jgi:Ca2+-binding RTX toxin-like protein
MSLEVARSATSPRSRTPRSSSRSTRWWRPAAPTSDRCGRAAAIVGIVASLIVPVAVAARALEPAGSSGCTISGTNGNDVLRGTASRDVICGRNGDDAFVGLGGDDRIVGGRGNDRIDGGPGADDLNGGRGADLVTGGGSDDHVEGGPSRDAIRGDSGSDIVQGGRGRDFCVATDDGIVGNDVANGGPGQDAYHADAGGSRRPRRSPGTAWTAPTVRRSTPT